MNVFNYVKKNLKIKDIASKYTELKEAGAYFKGKCPIPNCNQEFTAFTVSPKEIFYCFTCHKGGDIISLVAAIKNCSLSAATLELINDYKIEIPDELFQLMQKQKVVATN